MRITVHVRAGVRVNQVFELEPGVYRIFTTAAPEKGKANEAVITLLAAHFKVPRSRIRLVFGRTAREKIIEVTV